MREREEKRERERGMRDHSINGGRSEEDHL